MLLHEELRTRRVELHISQAELATRLQVSQQTISRWESGATSPGPRRIAELADALGLNLSALLRSAGYLLASDFAADTLRPTAAELGRMTTSELILFIDAGWQQLRGRLATPPSRRKPVD
ncbi:MAG: helix-turn-helix protein [Acidimicrobiaceae bacterium]|jgi:transcriptional regulator with XRE-family HTH domain